VETQTAKEAYADILADVGCNKPALDEHDKRVIEEVRTGAAKYKGSKTGLPGIPDSQKDVGGWDDYPEIKRPDDWDTDHDGMPNEWEKKNGLNPSDKNDGNGTGLSAEGYTNLEMYLNELAGDYEEKTAVRREVKPYDNQNPLSCFTSGNHLILLSPRQQEVRVRLFTLDGVEILSRRVTLSNCVQAKVALENFNTGIYLLRLESGGLARTGWINYL
jgi:hypothetical protein